MVVFLFPLRSICVNCVYCAGLIIVLICTSVLCEDKKWVWEKNSRNAKLRDADDLKGSPRYEIFEPEGGDFDYDRPQRPHQNYPGNRPNYRPPFGGPGPQRPPFGGNLGGPGGYYPNQNVDPGFNGLGGRPPFKRFDTCSCTEKFNCQSPGLSYVSLLFKKNEHNLILYPLGTL